MTSASDSGSSWALSPARSRSSAFAAYCAALSLVVTAVRDRFGPRLLTTVDLVAGSGLLGFAGLLGWRAVHEP